MNTYEFFSVLHECGRNAQYVDVLNALDSKGCSPVEAHDRLKCFLSDGFIEGELQAYGRISLTPKGLSRLQELKDLAENNAKNKRYKAFQNKLAVLSCLIPLVIFILGLLIEHWETIVSFFQSLLH